MSVCRSIPELKIAITKYHKEIVAGKTHGVSHYPYYKKIKEELKIAERELKLAKAFRNIKWLDKNKEQTYVNVDKAMEKIKEVRNRQKKEKRFKFKGTKIICPKCPNDRATTTPVGVCTCTKCGHKFMR